MWEYSLSVLSLGFWKRIEASILTESYFQCLYRSFALSSFFHSFAYYLVRWPFKVYALLLPKPVPQPPRIHPCWNGHVSYTYRYHSLWHLSQSHDRAVRCWVRARHPTLPSPSLTSLALFHDVYCVWTEPRYDDCAVYILGLTTIPRPN